MRKLILFVAATALTLPTLASAQTLEELARIVSEAARTVAQINQEREARFVRERHTPQQLRADARQ